MILYLGFVKARSHAPREMDLRRPLIQEGYHLPKAAWTSKVGSGRWRGAGGSLHWWFHNGPYYLGMSVLSECPRPPHKVGNAALVMLLRLYAMLNQTLYRRMAVINRSWS
jgi:hypothetical protein